MGSSRRTGNRPRLVWANRAIGLAFLSAVGSQLWVQVANASGIVEKARLAKRFDGKVLEHAQRGAILASDGTALARDDDSCVLGINFQKVPNSPGFFAALSAAVGISAAELSQMAANAAGFRDWRNPVTPEQVKRIRQVQLDWKADGISLARPDIRVYPLGEAAANLVGYVRDEDGGVSAIEGRYNEQLKGSDGELSGLKDRNGELLPMRMSPGSKPRLDGSTIELTIVPELQTAAYEAVKRTAMANGATTGSAVIISPVTGDILAMASWPSFDPNSLTAFRGSAEKTIFRNPCVTDAFEPGSTLKVLTLAKALDDKKWGPEQIFTCRGTMTVGKKSFGCDRSHNGGVHGTIDPEHAIGESCNLAAAQWAMKVGYEPWIDYMKQLGLLAVPNVGLPAEQPALFKRTTWAPDLQLATLGFGQSISVSPLALCNSFALLGNGGVRMRPRLIKSIGSQTVVVEEAGQIVSKESADVVLRYMQSVFDKPYGTGKTLRIPGYSLAGKTGTAQKHNKRGAGYVSNFVGFVPAKAPKAVVLVMIDDPKKQYYGAAVAGPAFREIAEELIRHFEISPDAERVNPKP